MGGWRGAAFDYYLAAGILVSLFRSWNEAGGVGGALGFLSLLFWAGAILGSGARFWVMKSTWPSCHMQQV